MERRDLKNISVSLILMVTNIVSNVIVLVIHMVQIVDIMQDAPVVDMDDLLKSDNFFGTGGTTLTIDLENYCVEALKMPIDNLRCWSRPMDYDAYRIHTVNGCQFVISGPELHRWKNSER